MCGVVRVTCHVTNVSAEFVGWGLEIRWMTEQVMIRNEDHGKASMYLPWGIPSFFFDHRSHVHSSASSGVERLLMFEVSFSCLTFHISHLIMRYLIASMLSIASVGSDRSRGQVSNIWPYIAAPHQYDVCHRCPCPSLRKRPLASPTNLLRWRLF